MTIFQAIEDLIRQHNTKPWWTACGVQTAEGVIIVYANKLKPALAAIPQKEHHGYPVVIKRMGKPRPL